MGSPSSADAPTWVLHEPRFSGDVADPERATSPWSGHRWFAYDLIRWMRPRRIVELGTHYGNSFLSFVQAVHDGGLDTTCHAVDTWRGDLHAGFYGEEVFERFTSVIADRFPDADIILHRCTFDEALGGFEDGSIDLLHIDGYHSYEAAKHDFETWLPKVARNGVVLMHDVGAASGYRSAEYFETEIVGRYAAFRFEHNFGLGVVLPHGTAGREFLFSDEFQRWRLYYEHRAGHELGTRQHRDQTRMIEERDAVIADQAGLIADRDEALATQARMIEERDRLIGEQARLVEDREAALAAEVQLIEERDELIAKQSWLVEERDRAISAQTRMIDERDRLIARQDELIAGRDAQIAATGQRIDALVRELRAVEEVLTPPPDVASSQHGVPAGSWREPARGGAAARTRSALRGLVRVLPARWERVLQGAAWEVDERRRRRSRVRAAERAVRPYLDAPWYREQSDRVVRAGREARDYVHGWWQHGRDPHPGFDGSFYTRFNDDLAFADVTPFEHYVTAGAREGRPSSDAVLRRRYPRGDAATTDDGQGGVVLHRPGRSPRPFDDLNAVPLDGVALVTADLWDTVIERTRPPESAKLDTAQFLVRASGATDVEAWDLYRRRVEVEARLATERASADGPGEYHIREVLAIVLEEAIGGRAPAGLVDEAVDHEVHREGGFSRPRDAVVAWLRRIADDGTRVAIVSDFYLDGGRLRELSRAAGVDPGDGEIVSSVDLGQSKAAGGRLHELVRRRCGVEPEGHLHVGDHPVSDVEMQLRGGGSALLVPRGEIHAAFPPGGVLEPAGLAASVERLVLRERPMGGWAGPPLPDRWSAVEVADEVAAFDAGSRFALLPTALVVAAIELARDLDTDRVLYLSREGALLARVHEALAREDLAAGIAGVPVPISRRASFAASLRRLEGTELERLWVRYRGQSYAELLDSLGLHPTTYLELLAAEGLDPAHRGSDEDLDRLLQRPRVRRVADAAITVQRSRLRELLDRTLGSDPVVVMADVGWRGTIQDNVARQYPDRLFHGVYLALLPALDPPLPNAGRHAVALDAELGEDTSLLERNVSVIERLLTPAIPAVVGYRRDDQGEVEPMVDDSALPPQPIAAKRERFHDGVVAAAPVVASVLDRTGATPRDLRLTASALLQRTLLEPAPIVAQLVLAHEQHEDFGTLRGHGRLDLEEVAGTLLAAVRDGRPPTLGDHNWLQGVRRHPVVQGVLQTFWPSGG